LDKVCRDQSIFFHSFHIAGAATKEALPRLILLKYKGGGGEDSPIALVGKGITFDTGGMNLKPSKSIEDMYMDMGYVRERGQPF
jgi:leucyl aminopeptidase